MGEKDRILKTFDKVVLLNQVKTAEDIIKQSQEQITKLTVQIQQQLGVAAFAKHLLEHYEVPEPKVASERSEDETVKG